MTEDQIIKKILELLPDLDFRTYMRGNGSSRESCVYAHGQVDAYLSVLGLKMPVIGTYQQITEQIRASIVEYQIKKLIS
jgi:hypothetical protein